MISLTLDDNIPIGKYRGLRVRDVAEKDNRYIIYMDKKEYLSFDPEVVQYAKDHERVMGLQDKFKFGEYLGISVKKVIEQDKKYIAKAMNKFNITFSDTVLGVLSGRIKL